MKYGQYTLGWKQFGRYGLRQAFGPRALGQGVGFTPTDVDAIALFARMVAAGVTPSVRVQQAYQAWIVERKGGNVWTLLDAIWVAGLAEGAALLNCKQNAFNLTKVVTPVVQTGPGGYFQSANASASYFDTGFNPTTAPTPQYVQNSAHLMIVSKDSTQVAGGLIGNTGSRIQTVVSSDNSQGRPINSGSTGTLAAPGFPGHQIITRTAAAVWEAYLDGADVGGGTGGSAAPSNETIIFCNARSAGGAATNKLRMGSIGGGMTALQAIAAHDADTTFLAALDAALS